MNGEDQLERALRRYRAAGPPASLEWRVLSAAQEERVEREQPSVRSPAPSQYRPRSVWPRILFPAAATALLAVTLSFLVAAERLTARASESMVFEPAPAPSETDRVVDEVLGAGTAAIVRSRRVMMSTNQPRVPDTYGVRGAEDVR